MSLSQSILRGCTKAMTLQPRIINSMPFQRKLDVYVCDQTRCSRSFSSKVVVSQTRSSNAEIKSISADKSASEISTPKGCALTPEELAAQEEEEAEQEEMFVEPHPLLGTNLIEWGGPRRGGRFEEPTRFGDWERKGRCTDF